MPKKQRKISNSGKKSADYVKKSHFLPICVKLLAFYYMLNNLSLMEYMQNETATA